MNAPTTIMEAAALAAPRVLHGLDIHEYHGGPGISKSGLDDIEKSPAIYYARHLDPNRPPEPPRRDREGELAHCAILEPDQFAKRYATLPKDAPRRPTDAQWNAKNPSPESVAAMDWWRDWNAKTGGAIVISNDEYETAMRQADSVRKLPEVREALSRGFAEASAYWIDPVTGELCRCRPDWTYLCGSSECVLWDVKTYASAAPSEFRRQVARMRYHVQDAFYSDGFAAASGLSVLAFAFVAVESAWPHAACAVMLDEPSRDQGRREYRRNLVTYANCRETGNWPGYSERIEIVTLPAWALSETE